MAKPDPRILWSPQSEADLVEIWRYGAAATSPAHADDHLTVIHAACVRLADWPDSGHARPELADGLRSIAVAPHVVFYRRRGDKIEIVRVLHGARDLDAIFGDDGEV